jgi:NitT/TauT family transport system ATP-binding protein
MSRPILQARGISRVFESAGSSEPLTALRAMDLNLDAGEVVCLVGSSGCGKSTFLNIVAGLDWPTSGELLLDGVALEQPGADRGMVFQRDSLFPWLSVRDNVLFGLSLRATRRSNGMALTRLYSHADELLQRVGLWDFRDSYPKQLSGGMRQRAGIVRALATRPAILLMDEPFGALDAQTREEMQVLLLELCAEQHTTVLFVTHDVEEAVFLGDRVVVMQPRPGRVVADIPVPLPRPRNQRTKLRQDFQEIRGQVLDQLYESMSERKSPEPSPLISKESSHDAT